MSEQIATAPSLELERGPTEKLVISARTFKTNDYVEGRLYWLRDDGEWLPTRKGSTIKSPDEVDQVVAVLQEIRGTLPGPSVD